MSKPVKLNTGGLDLQPVEFMQAIKVHLVPSIYTSSARPWNPTRWTNNKKSAMTLSRQIVPFKMFQHVYPQAVKATSSERVSTAEKLGLEGARILAILDVAMPNASSNDVAIAEAASHLVLVILVIPVILVLLAILGILLVLVWSFRAIRVCDPLARSPRVVFSCDLLV